MQKVDSMKKSILIGLCMILITLSLAAADYTNPTFRWSWDDADRSGNNIYELVSGYDNLTNNGATLGVAGKFGEAAKYDGSNDFMVNTNQSFGNNLSMYSLSIWVNTTTADLVQRGIFSKNDGVSKNLMQLWDRYQETPDDLWYSDGDSVQSNVDYAVYVANGDWVNIIIVYNGSNLAMYIDGAYINSGAKTGLTQSFTDTIEFGQFGGNYWKGEIDEACFYWEYVLTASDIANLQNSTCSAAAPPPASSDSLLAYAVTAYNGSTILAFNATIENNATYGTTTGLINQSLDMSRLYNITIWAPDHLNNVTYLDHNISTTITATLWAAVLNLTAQEYLSNDAINAFNASAGTYFNKTTTGNTIHYLEAGTFVITASTQQFYAAEPLSVTISALETQEQTLTFYNILNLSAYDLPNQAFISNYSINLSGKNYTQNELKTTTNGTMIFKIINQTYNLSIIADGYADNFGTSILRSNFSSPFTHVNFNLYTTNSFNISFRDESTLALINTTTINLDLISDVFSGNYSTTTGTLYIDLLTPAEYTFRYSGTGFQPRISSYTLTPSTYNDITLWLLPGGENVSIFIYDQSSNFVEGAIIQIYRYSAASNSYFLVNTIATDFTGQAITNLELNSEFYKFFIYYNGDLKKQTAGAYITGTELTFEINIDEPIAQTYYSIQDVDGYVSFNELTNNFRFYFNDQAGSVSRGCLYLYKVSVATETLYNSSCVSGSSALILLNAANVSGQRYTATGYVTIGGVDYLFDSYSYTFKEISNYGSFGLLMVLFLTIIFGLLMIWSIEISLILLPIPSLIGSLPAFNWINLPTEYAVGMEVIMLVLAFIIRKRGF